jgi:hypothetical protein
MGEQKQTIPIYSIISSEVILTILMHQVIIKTIIRLTVNSINYLSVQVKIHVSMSI